MGCNFLRSLQTLKKHSAESVDFADSISDQSKYLHVHRQIEDDLIALLGKAQESNRKSLVLLCGSAGDGKSHMLSYLKNGDHSCLLDGFAIRNDATESDAPNRTAPETLAKALTAFDDEHFDDGGLEKMVVAINLGLLSRFLESSPGTRFTQLASYVDRLGLLKTGRSDTVEDLNRVFYAVDFSDYQIFTIEKAGVKTDFVDTLLNKIFAASSDNPFYVARCNACSECGIDTTLCPVKQNYDYMRNKCVRDSISKMLVEIALREKCVITARAVLDFAYEALVAPDFDIEALIKKNASSPREYAPEYLSMTTPQLLFSSQDSTGLIAKFASLDPMNDDSGWVDEVTTTFRASPENVGVLFQGVKNTPYNETISICSVFSAHNISSYDSVSADIRDAILCFAVRGAYLMGSCDAIKEGFVRNNYISDFVRLIFDFNTGNEKGLHELKKKLLSKAIEDWNGDYPNKFSLVETYGDIQLLQKLTLAFGDSALSSGNANCLTRFRPEICVKATNKDKSLKRYVDFQVDYNIFELLKKMESGYQPTLMDKTLFSGFESNYRRLLAQGTKDSCVYVVRRSNGKQPFLEFQLDEDLEFSSERM